MKEEWPLISVVIPTYNRDYCIAEAIQSVIDQNYENIEIIVIDDGSEDNTRNVLEKYRGLMRYYYQSNAGPASARNLGVSLARGHYISFLDSDDIWLSGKIYTELALFYEHPEVHILAGNAEYYREKKLLTPSIFNKRKIKFSGGNTRYFDWSISIMRKGPVCVTSAMTITRSALDQLKEKPFDESLRYDEDWDLEFKLFSMFQTMLYEDVLTRVRMYDDGTRKYYSFSGKSKTQQEKMHIWETHRVILERYINQIDWSECTARAFSQEHQLLLNLLSDA